MRFRLQAFCSALMEAGWLAASAIIPLFFNPSSVLTFEPDKMMVLKALVVLSGAAWLVKRLADDGWKIPQGIPSLLRKPLVQPILVLAVIYLLSTFFSIVPVLSLWGSYYEAQGTVAFLCYLILFAIMYAELRSPAHLKRLQYIIILTSLPLSIYAILQYFGGDPFQWVDTFLGRSGGSLGNPIFLGGYLVMVIPLTLCRTVEGLKLLRSGADRRPTLVLVGCCSVALIVQVLALFYTQSRGPLLGLVVAGYLCLFVLLVLYRAPQKARIVSFTIAVGLGFVFPCLVFIAIKVMPRFFGVNVLVLLAAAVALVVGLGCYLWRIPWGRSWLWLAFMVQTLALVVGFAIISTGAAKERPGSPKSFSRMLQFSDGSVRYRKALWETGARFLQAGPQPILPDGTRDSNYLLRRAIGYGPECSWLVTNSFATPALVLNRFQESENRMHNEIFDAIITTGYAGTMAYLWIIVAAYYYSLRFFGFAVERLEKIIYVVLSCVGIAAGFCVPWAVGTPQFIGIGVEAGLLAGIFAFVAWSGFRNVRERFEMGGRQLLVLGILGALTAHFIEIGVAVAVTPTRLYFYLYLAVLAVCCSRGWVSEEEPAKRNKGKSLRPDASPLLPFAALSALVVFVESWCFTFSVSDEKSALTLFAQSWFGFFSGDRGRMPTALVLILVTLCAGAGLAYAEKPGVQISRAGLRRSILGSTASLLAAWVATGMISALFWTALENATPLEYSRHCEARITFFVLGLLLLVTIAALIINNREMAQSRVSAIPMKKALIAILLFSFAVIGIWRLTLRPAWADTACRIARAYEAARNYVGAAQQYERASQFAPQVVPYRFSLGLAQRAAAGLDSMQLEQARASIEKALDLNRLDPIVYRTLGTFHMYVGEHSLESQARASEIAKAIGHFQKAARLAPNHPDAYVQMGRCLSLLGEYDRANGFFQKSLQMNPNYWQCYKYLGEMQYRQKDFSGALKSFEKAAYLNPDDMDSPKNIGVLLMLLGRTEDAIRANLEALKKAPNDFELLTRVASWYFGQGNNVTGTEFAKRAYDVSPSANKGSFEAFKGRLQSQMRN